MKLNQPTQAPACSKGPPGRYSVIGGWATHANPQLQNATRRPVYERDRVKVAPVVILPAMSETFSLNAETVEWRDIDGDIVILGEAHRNYMTLNASGAVLWRALAGGATRAQLEQELESAFGSEVEDASVDVEAFLEALREKGLLVTS